MCSYNELKNIKQLAYKLGHSTKTVLLLIKNDANLALARSEATPVVLLELDQSTALNTINYGILLDCFSSLFGIGGVVLDCFKSYL